MITVATGYLTMAWMFYLIMITNTTAPKIWDPYNILDISRVGRKLVVLRVKRLIISSHQVKPKSRSDTEICPGFTILTKR